MQDMRKRKRVGSLAEGPADAIVPPSYRPAPATFIPPSIVSSSSSSPSFQHDSTSSPCSPSPSYHLPQFLAASPCLDDASPTWSHNNRGAEFNAACPSDRHLTALSEENLVSQSPSLTLSCGESSLNTTMTEDDRYTSAAGDETPNGQSDASLSESSTYWGGEESAEAFSESPASLLSSSLSSLSTSSTLLEDLSALGTVLSDEIYLEERRKELTSPTIEIGQEYHKTRPIVVDWMLDVGDYFSFHGATTHLAVAYLDRMLSLMVIERNKLQLVATACLLIAAKVEEVPNKVPTVPEFNERTLNTYTPELIRTCERVVLNHLEWSLIVTTPRSMLDFFLAEISCISYDDLIHGVPLSYARSREVEDWAVTTAHTVMTMIVLDHQFLRFQPSILAAVCLAVARRQARIEPLWPQRMERKTGYTFNEISECFHFTWAKQEIALANQAMEGQWGT